MNCRCITMVVVLALLASGVAIAQDDDPILNGMVDIGGYELYIDCQGEGSPTVVMEAGFGDTGRSWLRVHHKIAAFTRVCVYDRAGMGGSDPSPITPRTTQVITDELHTLLHTAGIEGPYVLVGHSFGGYIVRLFAYTYPDEVAGLVLNHTPHEDQPTSDDRETRDRDELLFGAREPLTVGEWLDSMEEVRGTRSTDETFELGELPLVVLTALDYPPPIWPMELQEDLATLSENGTHIIVEDSGHYIHNDQPEVFIDAVQEVVEAARASAEE